MDGSDYKISEKLLCNTCLSKRSLSLKLALTDTRLQKEKVIKNYFIQLNNKKSVYNITAVMKMVTKKDSLLRCMCYL